jgi:hypothetical protein
MTRRVPHDRLQMFLDGLAHVGYAVAKNPDIWASLDRGGDWDVVVADLGRSERLLVDSLGPPKRCVRRSYVSSYFYDWGSIDLLPDIRWRGVILVPGRQVVAEARLGSDGRTPIARPAHQAVAGWIAPVLAWGGYKSRYDEVLAEAVRSDGKELGETLSRIFGDACGSQVVGLATGDAIDAAVIARLRRRALVQSTLADPVGTFRRLARFAHREAVVRSPWATSNRRSNSRESAWS